LGPRFSPRNSLARGDSPSFWPRKGKMASGWGTAVKTSKDVSGRFVGNSSARAKKHCCLVIARLGVSDFESGSHNPEGFKGAPPVAESSDRRSRAGAWLVASKAQREALAPTRTVGSNLAPATRKRNTHRQVCVFFLLWAQTCTHVPGYEPEGRITGGGRLRALPAADEASKKEWQRSKFCAANSERRISGTATGRRSALLHIPASQIRLPQPWLATNLDTSPENPETTTVSGVFRTPI